MYNGQATHFTQSQYYPPLPDNINKVDEPPKYETLATESTQTAFTHGVQQSSSNEQTLPAYSATANSNAAFQ